MPGGRIALHPADDRAAVALPLKGGGDVVLHTEAVRRHRGVRRDFRRVFGTGSVVHDVRAARPGEREVVGVVRAVVKNTSPVAGCRLRRPDFDRGGGGVEQPCAKVERARARAIPGQLRLAVGNHDGRADLRRGGVALGVVETAVEAPAVRKRDSRLRNRRAEVEVKPVDVADAASDALAARTRPDTGEAGVDLLLDLRRR